MFNLGEVRKFIRLVDGEVETLEGRIVGRTFQSVGERRYDFKVGDHIVLDILEGNIVELSTN